MTRVMRKVFGPKRGKVTGKRRRLHNEEFYAVYSLPNIWVIKSRRIRWVGHVVRTGNRRGAHGLLVGRPDGRRQLGRPRCRWSIILK